MLYFIINIAIGIILVPYFISTLGVAAYGLIPLATAISGYVVILIQALNTAVSRYLTIDLQREDYVAANQTFNTAIFGFSAIIIMMMPLFVVVSFLLSGIFLVPAGQDGDVTLLFLGVCGSFLIRAWSGNFTVQLFAYNRLDLQNVVNVTNILVQAALIVVLFKVYTPSLALVGAAYLAGAIAASIVAIILSKRICPYLKVSIGSFNKSRLKDLFSMGSWAIVNLVGTVLFLQIDLIAVNLLFGSASAGEYSIVLQLVVLIRGVGDMISGTLTPIVYTYYAQGQLKSLTSMMIGGDKVTGLAMALPIGFICGFAAHRLSLWVGEKFVFLAPLMMLMISHLAINLAVLPLFSINVAYNKIKVPGLVTIFLGVANAILAIALPLLTGWGYYGVAIAGAIILSVKNLVFTPWYTTRILGTETSIFLKSMLPGISATILLVSGITILKAFIPINSFIPILFTGCAISLVYVILVWRFFIPPPLRRLVSSALTNIRLNLKNYIIMLKQYG
jgi:membrane protein EpsK